MSKNKVKIYLRNVKTPFVFNLKLNKFLELLNIIDEAEENEIINIENIYFVKKEFIYAIFN